MRQILERVIPYLALGIIFLGMGFGVALFFYLLGYLICFGLLLGFLQWLRLHFFSSTPPQHRKLYKSDKRPGRIIDTDEWKEI